MSFRAKMQLDDASKLMTIEMGKPLPPCRTDSPQGAASSRCKASAGGLLPEPPRTSEGHRDYPAGAAARLAFICDAQAAGLTLAEIRAEGSRPQGPLRPAPERGAAGRQEPDCGQT